MEIESAVSTAAQRFFSKKPYKQIHVVYQDIPTTRSGYYLQDGSLKVSVKLLSDFTQSSTDQLDNVDGNVVEVTKFMGKWSATASYLEDDTQEFITPVSARGIIFQSNLGSEPVPLDVLQYSNVPTESPYTFENTESIHVLWDSGTVPIYASQDNTVTHNITLQKDAFQNIDLRSTSDTTGIAKFGIYYVGFSDAPPVEYGSPFSPLQCDVSACIMYRDVQ